MQQQRDLHSSEGRDQTFDTTTLGRKVADGTFMLKLVTLHQGARHTDDKSAVLARNQRALPSSFSALGEILCRGGSQASSIVIKPLPFCFFHA
jgi:hypothetical protein